MDVFVIIKILLKNLIEIMGNTTQVPPLKVAGLHSSASCRNTDMRLIGPSHLPFTKMHPKTIDINEDLLNAFDQDIVTREMKNTSQTQGSQSSEEYEQTVMESNVGEYAIKIKWNSFIKLKKKNYLDDYVVIKEIGKGGFGTVSKVQAKYTGVMRAAKKIKKSSLAKNQHEKLLEEMAIMITLDHPNIARLFQVYDYKHSYVLILELCQGGELFKKITTQTISESIAASVMARVLNALLYIHAKGIVHRDLKPQNILFQDNTKYSNLKLIDFGIAVRKDKSQKLSTRIGTPYYIAPQVLCKSYDQKCDIWSAGVILYMMLCYRPPFNGDSQTQVMECILKSEPSYSGAYFKNVSEDCLDLLKKMLTKNPEHRPSALEAFQHPWVQRFSKASCSNHDSTLQNLSTFKFDNRLQAVVFTYIVSQILTSQQKETIKELFEVLDKNHDGVISIQELKHALKSRKEISEDRIDFLMRIIDTNNSGEIDFTEFTVAALQPQKFSKEHFQQAFAYFDMDHSGFITYDEIASFLENKQHSQEEICKIFKEIDQNHDGKISQQEFLKVLCMKGKERMEKERKKTRKALKTSNGKEKKDG